MADNQYNNQPIKPSPHISVIIAQSSSAIILEGSGTSPEEVADAVLNELIAEHLDAGSTGKIIEGYKRFVISRAIMPIPILGGGGGGGGGQPDYSGAFRYLGVVVPAGEASGVSGTSRRSGYSGTSGGAWKQILS